MTLWVIGSATLLGLYRGWRQGRREVLRHPLYRQIERIAGKKRKNIRVVYRRDEILRSLRRYMAASLLLIILALGLGMIFLGRMSFLMQVLPAIWAGYFANIFARKTVSDYNFSREPLLVIAPGGLWAREEGPEVGFRHTRWRDIEKVRIRRGSTGGDTKDGKSCGIEVRLSDGTYFAQQGLRCAPVPLADKLGRWLPVRLIELRRPRSGESQKESTLK